MSTEASKSARVHRFHDKVALYIGETETVYLNPKLALALARTIMLCVEDIGSRKFVLSEFETTELEDQEQETEKA